MKGRVQFRKILPEEFEALREQARQDAHEVIFPTHVAEKDGELVGYFSMGMVPTVNWWMDSEKVQVRDSLRALEAVEMMMDDRGVSHYLMMCEPESPYFGLMEKVGFDALGPTVMHIKKVGG